MISRPLQSKRYGVSSSQGDLGPGKQIWFRTFPRKAERDFDWKWQRWSGTISIWDSFRPSLKELNSPIKILSAAKTVRNQNTLHGKVFWSQSNIKLDFLSHMLTQQEYSGQGCMMIRLYDDIIMMTRCQDHIKYGLYHIVRNIIQWTLWRCYRCGTTKQTNKQGKIGLSVNRLLEVWVSNDMVVGGWRVYSCSSIIPKHCIPFPGGYLQVPGVAIAYEPHCPPTITFAQS